MASMLVRESETPSGQSPFFKPWEAWKPSGRCGAASVAFRRASEPTIRLPPDSSFSIKREKVRFRPGQSAAIRLTISPVEYAAKKNQANHWPGANKARLNVPRAMAEPSPTFAKRIIVADDHPWIRQAMVRMVIEILPTAEIIEAADGLEALQAYQQSGADFLVTDHQMPRMDGMTLIRRIREPAPDLPILMVSVNAHAKTDALAAGATWFSTKEEIGARLPELLRG